MPYACIDIGSNTTRLLVAEPAADGLRRLVEQRAFTRIGKGLSSGGQIPGAKVAEVAEVVAGQVRLARELGARSVRAVATAAIRAAGNGAELASVVAKSCGVPVEILTDEEEARLAFRGATCALAAAPPGDIAVVDVGGGSCELAVGTVSGGVHWSTSLPLGSGALADAHLRSDPPTAAELAAVRAAAADAFAPLRPPKPQLALAVGGSATSLWRLSGGLLDAQTLARCVTLVTSAPAVEVARRYELEPERVALLPAGIALLAEASQCLGTALSVGGGGLREGVLLELIAANGKVEP